MNFDVSSDVEALNRGGFNILRHVTGLEMVEHLVGIGKNKVINHVSLVKGKLFNLCQ